MTAALATARVPDAPHGDFHITFRPPTHAAELPCWLAFPAVADPGARPLVAVHGIRRGAREQAALFGARAAALGRVVVAPLFDIERWPAYQRIGGARRSDEALLELLEGLRAEGLIGGERFDLFGFSAGAQFAHRFAMLHPGRVHQLSVASAGWYTFPDNASFPYGLRTCGGSLGRSGRSDELAARMRASLDDFLRLPIQVLVGSRDRVRDANLRGGPEINRQQGRDRCARAARWVDALTVEAAVRGIERRIRLTALPGVGHDFAACVRRAGLVDQVLPVPGEAVQGPFGASSAAWPRVPHRGPHAAATPLRC